MNCHNKLIKLLTTDFSCIYYNTFPVRKQSFKRIIFSDACLTRNILHFRDKETNKRYKAFAYHYYYGYLYDQTNYCIIYENNDKTVKAIPLYRIQDI